jgi:UDP-N-acetylglucosamine:LPS N-acetylglucosamine transferase
MKIAIVSSVGGHLSEVLELREVYEAYDHFYILNAPRELPPFMRGKTYFIAHAERDWRHLWNLAELSRLFRKEQPDCVLSCGAGCAVPALLVAKLMGVRGIYIETFCALYRPSLTGRIIHTLRLADEFLYQWPYLAPFFPRGRFAGAVYDPRFRRHADATL